MSVAAQRTPASRAARMPAGFHLLIAAQFASALADSALLIVAIALLQERGLPGWWAPLLKFAFTLSYVFLAPVVGALSDAFAKARLMAWMNAVKWLGVVGLLAGANPVAAFVVIGFGAAAYAPAKYGLVTELVPAHRLVAANGWIEASVVCAALLGTVLGGLLVSPAWVDSEFSGAVQQGLSGGWFDVDSALSASLVMLLGLYGLAGGLNLGVPDSGARYPASQVHPVALSRDFWRANLTLWRDRDGGLSLAVTTIFWGAGATLQFAVLRWGAEVLHLPLDHSAYLQAAVAVGVVVGAVAAGRWVPLAHSKRMLVAGVAFGLLIPVIASTSHVAVALPLLALAGTVGGLLVVPLNALLQHRGCTLLSAGRSVAVQGFNENASVLLMLGAYAALTALELPIPALMWGLGLFIAGLILLLMWRERRQARSANGAPE